MKNRSNIKTNGGAGFHCLAEMNEANLLGVLEGFCLQIGAVCEKMAARFHLKHTVCRSDAHRIVAFSNQRLLRRLSKLLS
jgi:hypothetical protein